MTVPLVSDSEMEALREVALMGMQTEVMVLARTTIQTDDGQQDHWPETGPTYMGWLYTEPQPRIVINAGEQATPNLVRLFLPVGTPLVAGDHVVAETFTYTVVDTTQEGTWKPLLRCNIRRME